jgi:hypothetical protein
MRVDDILRKLGIMPINNESFQIFIACIKTLLEYAEDIGSLKYWNAPILPDMNRLNSSEIELIKSEVQKTSLSISDCQIKVQKLIPQETRKKFAAYYTIEHGRSFMACVVRDFLRGREDKVVLADPFLGSGSTLTTTIEKIGVERVQKVWGVEPLPLPALVAYASLLHSMKGKREIVDVVVGDAFEVSSISPPFLRHELPKADIILTNPPFTRWKYLDEKYRKYLLQVIERLGYGKYITRRDISLQALSMFLCDHILRDGGLLISVLPASTFYTIYGRGYKSLLRERYEVLAIVECKLRASFSEDSGFKEVIMVAVKGSGKVPTTFIELDADVEKAAKLIHGEFKSDAAINLHNLPRFLDLNWLVFFEEKELRDIVLHIFEQGLKNKTLGYWEDILGKGSIIRGVEMYGPEFFFIPNKYWKTVVQESNFIKIQNVKDDRELVIDKKFLTKTLRKPSLYSHKIEAEVDTFMLSIPSIEVEELTSDIQDYIKWGANSGTAEPAIKAYGRLWYSHVYSQMVSKKPFGYVFIPDKVDLLFKNRGVFANYTKERVAASKNFYIVKGEDKMFTKLLTGWFNSTIFLSVLVLMGRRISETWTRFLENDYLELPVINPNIYDDEKTSQIVENIDKMANKYLPSFWEQLNSYYRYEFDLSVARYIGIENPEKALENLYRSLSNLLRKT